MDWNEHISGEDQHGNNSGSKNMYHYLFPGLQVNATGDEQELKIHPVARILYTLYGFHRHSSLLLEVRPTKSTRCKRTFKPS